MKQIETNHKVLTAETESLRRQIIKNLIEFGELTDRPDQVSEWRWFDKMCYQNDMAILKNHI